MLLNSFTRAGMTAMTVLLLVTAACRSHTDRIRVLEAEKADAMRQNQELRQDQAEMKAKLLEEESRAESYEARTRALEAKVDLLKDKQPSEIDDDGPVMIDPDRLRRVEGDGVEVFEGRDGSAKIVLASDVTFRAGRADLNRKAQSSLERVASQLKEQSGAILAVRIEGHTDSDPIRKSGWKSNRELSRARAERVRAFLVRHGLDEHKLRVEGLGASRPIASNASVQGKARNRRVEIVLVTRQG